MRNAVSYRAAAVFVSALLFTAVAARTQERREPGKPIGKVSTLGHLIVLELDESVLGKSNLFDLTGRTLRFTRERAGYRVKSGPLQWDPQFGSQIEGSDVTLRKFTFPFSGRAWDAFSVGTNGSIRFEKAAAGPGGGRGGGVQIGRFDQLAQAARTLVNTVPAICVFTKPRLIGPRYAKELGDRVVITWDLSEPWGNIQDFTWVKTVNRFQAVLHRDGSIDMSYEQLAAKDAIVGIYPTAAAGPDSRAASEVDLSSLTPKDGPFPIVYESFHYLALPNPRDLTCSVIKTLGDKFDFLAYYSDFRVDNQEAGTPSTGPRGSTGAPVTGIGAPQRGLDAYCSAGRFQWQFIQPVYVGSNQMQEQPPADAPVGTNRDITFYRQQLAERSQDGKIPPYMYAMSQIAHEMGHRWGAFASATIDGETIPLGPTHWARGLQAPVAYPYQRPTEASAMGGGVWQDNVDGTFTQLDDDYYVPATGWSYLDLYLMGLIAPSEVPDFFLLRNLVPAGRDGNGRPIFKADRTKITIQDVIAAEGPRTPAVDTSQRLFNTGMVAVVEHGKKPSRELLERTEGIREQWTAFWPITTGHRVVMTADPR
jgi:hypothetical protein